MVETTQEQDLDYKLLAQNLLDEDLLSAQRTFLGKEMDMRVSTLQQTANLTDHHATAFVIDVRSKKQFFMTHLQKAVNLPLEMCQDFELFSKWDGSKVEKEMQKINDKKDMTAFAKRRRHWVFIIGVQNSDFLTQNLFNLPEFFQKDTLQQKIDSCKDDSELSDLISFRTAVLLYKTLKNERVREVHFCVDGHDKVQERYAQFLIEKNNRVLPMPSVAKYYPNEILPNRLWLGDWHNAADINVIEQIGITHVLNISDSCENYFEESHPHMTYLHIDIGDTKDKPIKEKFPEVCQFVDVAFDLAAQKSETSPSKSRLQDKMDICELKDQVITLTNQVVELQGNYNKLLKIVEGLVSGKIALPKAENMPAAIDLTQQKISIKATTSVQQKETDEFFQMQPVATEGKDDQQEIQKSSAEDTSSTSPNTNTNSSPDVNRELEQDKSVDNKAQSEIMQSQFSNLQSKASFESEYSVASVQDEKRRAVKQQVISKCLLKINMESGSVVMHCTQQEQMFVHIQQFFRELNDQKPENKNKMLVHCAMGASRSATCVIMYIMRKFQISLDDAFEYVKTQRFLTDPNEGFIQQLEEFEKHGYKFASEENDQSVENNQNNESE